MEQPLKRWVVTGGVAFWWGVAQGRGLKEAWPERWYGGVASMGLGRDLERGLGARSRSEGRLSEIPVGEQRVGVSRIFREGLGA